MATMTQVQRVRIGMIVKTDADLMNNWIVGKVSQWESAKNRVYIVPADGSEELWSTKDGVYKATAAEFQAALEAGKCDTEALTAVDTPAEVADLDQGLTSNDSEAVSFEDALAADPQLAAELAESNVEDADEDADQATTSGVHIRPQLENYVQWKDDSGKTRCDSGDSVAELLRSIELDELFRVVAYVLGAMGVEEIGRGKRKIQVSATALIERYSHLNNGQQRMNLGNVLRGAVRNCELSEAELAKLIIEA